MGTIFSSSEVVAFGVQIKKNGRDFYDLASKTVKADRVRQLFEFLSNDEQLHIGAFEGILSRVDESPRAHGHFPSEYGDYLRALVEGNAFTVAKQGSELARALRNDKQALDLALSYEKDTMLFCHELKKLVWPGFHKEIDTLLAEEQDHFTKISDVAKGFNKFGVGCNRE